MLARVERVVIGAWDPKAGAVSSLFDVVRVTEDSFAMAECFEAGEIECPLVDSCGLNAALRKALNAFFEVLQQYTIDDLVKARPQIGMLLGLENAVARQPAA